VAAPLQELLLLDLDLGIALGIGRREAAEILVPHCTVVMAGEASYATEKMVTSASFLR